MINDDDTLAAKLTEHFTKASAKAVDDLHAQGLPVHGDVDGVWQEIAPKYDKPPMTTKHLTSLSLYDFDGPIDEIIARLQALKVKYPDYQDLSINGDYEYSEFSPSDRCVSYRVQGKRSETPAETRAREKAERLRVERLEAEEKRQLEFLKKKYEG